MLLLVNVFVASVFCLSNLKASLHACIQDTRATAVFQSSGPSYNLAKLGTFNVASPGFLENSPVAITYPSTPKQIGQLVKCARQYNIQVTARSGGHSYEGYNLSPGIIVDLANFTDIRVDSSTSTAVIGAGNWLGKIAYDLYDANKSLLPGGVCPAVGIGGHALGGGFGYSSRKYGLVSDAILEMTVINANGKVLTVSKDQHPNMFWAMRGSGGGNFGIVSSFKFKIFPAPKAVTVASLWFPTNLATAISIYTREASILIGDFFLRMEYDLQNNGAAALTIIFHGDQQTYSSHPQLQAFIANFKGLNYQQSISQHSSMNDVMFGSNNNAKYLRTRTASESNLRFKASSVMFTGQLSSNAINALLNAPVPASFKSRTWFQLDTYGGKVSSPDGPASSFNHREFNIFDVQLYTSWESASEDAQHHALISQWRGNIAPFGNGQSYQNYIDRGVPLREYYGVDGLERLKRIKRRVDPTNLWRFAQSIPLSHI